MMRKWGGGTRRTGRFRRGGALWVWTFVSAVCYSEKLESRGLEGFGKRRGFFIAVGRQLLFKHPPGLTHADTAGVRSEVRR